jgi:hypothetical protein
MSRACVGQIVGELREKIVKIQRFYQVYILKAVTMTGNRQNYPSKSLENLPTRRL